MDQANVKGRVMALIDNISPLLKDGLKQTIRLGRQLKDRGFVSEVSRTC